MTELNDEAELLALLEANAGLGVSFDPADQERALITVLQSNSPETNTRNVEYIDKAEAGDYRFKNSTVPIVSGETGFEGVVLGRRRGFAEFKPDRGGFEGWHAHRPDNLVPISNSRRQQYQQAGNPNVFEESVDLLLLVDGAPHLFPCTSTKIAFTRRLNSDMLQRRFEGTDRIMPSCAHRYKFTTKRASNALGSWYGPEFTYLGRACP
jgi:hypothetical protein